MRDLTIATTAASYSGNKGAAAMLQSSISQLRERYGEKLTVNLMSVYPKKDREQVPWDFVKIVPAKPERLIFLAFPLAVLYWIFRTIPPVRALLLKNKILKAYSQSDLVVDEAGISFVDDRGFVMNTYAFICAAVPLLMGLPVVKYSQAMGPFKNRWNRFLAKWILPKLKLICARGKVTEEHLREIGVTENVRLCADGAFTMPDGEEAVRAAAADPFYDGAPVVGVSLSSVVDKKCKAKGIPYRKVMTGFIDYLTGRGFKVEIIANAARLESDKPRNNDLMVCDDVYSKVARPEMVRWQHRECTAEEIRAMIGRCRFLVASRFHAMIGALEQKVPVLLVGWSHKYQEVLDFFELGRYAIDFGSLSGEKLQAAFESFEADEQEIRSRLDEHLEEVQESSRQNIRLISGVIDSLPDAKEKRGAGVLDFGNSRRYAGEYIRAGMAYASDREIRKNAASGGVVTAFLCRLLREGVIDGALLQQAVFTGGVPSARIFIAKTEDEIRSASSSVYIDAPLLSHLDEVRDFDGKLAVAAVPCMMRGIAKRMESDPVLREKIALKIGLFCSGNPAPECAALALKKAGIGTAGAKRLYFRRGHWRGMGSVIFENGSEASFSYAKTVCAYKNAYFFERARCELCQDHFAAAADISFGDIWLKEMKKEEIKHTCVVIRSEKADRLYREAVEAGEIVHRRISGRNLIRGQKRALVYKFCCAKAKEEALGRLGHKVSLDTEDRCRWNHRLVSRLATFDRNYSEKHPEALGRIPSGLVYLYMCFIRALLSF